MASDVQRRTQQKAAIQEALSASEEFIGAQELHARMKGEGSGIGLATVYRTLNELVARGQADVLTSASGQLFRFCGTGHHHHLVCVECGKTVEVDAPIEEWVDSVATANGFVRVRHVLDILGVCSECQARISQAGRS